MSLPAPVHRPARARPSGRRRPGSSLRPEAGSRTDRPGRAPAQPAVARRRDQIEVERTARPLLRWPLVVVLLVDHDQAWAVHQLGRDLEQETAGTEKPPRPQVARCAAWVR